MKTAAHKGAVRRSQVTAGTGGIAIVGMACRFPGANGYEQFWDNLQKGVNSIKEITPDRWDIGEYYSPNIDEPNKSVSKWAGLMDGIYDFDHQFFQISPREATNMDPQQRLLLEGTWHCIEDSGIPLRALQEKTTSVYVGVMAADNRQEAVLPGLETDSYACLGNYESILANRISYTFDLRGASVPINAACASSLVAIHEAKRSLLLGEIDYALAGCCNLNLHPWKYISFSKSRMLSPDGQCKTFDKDANGYVPGDGVGVLLLQRLEDAIRDGNRIYGIVKGTAVNHGGKSQSITAPRVEAQREVILAAYQDAGFSPQTVGYVEAHGTGTSLGDPIEIESLTQAFRTYTEDNQFCRIGSVKTNIGHLEGAAGIAGVIKVLMMMRHRKIPKTLNIRTVNPIIEFERTPFMVADSLDEWQSSEEGLPLRAGVSSFGFGGVNSHILLEEYIEATSYPSERGSTDGDTLFTLSARTPQGLKKLVADWQHFIESEDFAQLRLEDLGRTLLVGRKDFPHRIGTCVSSKEELKRWIGQGVEPLTASAKRSWCLRVGTLPWSRYADVEPLLREFDGMKQHLHELLRKLAVIDGNRRLSKGFHQEAWAGPYRPLYLFLAGFAYAKTLLDVGFAPDTVSGEKHGVWVAMAVSGLMKPDEILAVLAGRQELEQVKLARPSIPFVDPVTQQVLTRYRFDVGYVHSLLDGLTIDHKPVRSSLFDKGFDMESSSAEMLAQPLTCEEQNETLFFYINKARLLNESQYTFKKHMDEWDEITRKVSGYEIKQLLHDERLLTDESNVFQKEKLLLVTVIVSSLHKLNQKWNLMEQKRMEDDRFYELIDLITDEVMPKEMLIGLLTGEQLDIQAVADILHERQNRLSPANEYRYLNERNRSVDEIADTADWIKKLVAADTSVTVQADQDGVELGSLATSMESSVQARLAGDVVRSFQETLLQLWLRGMETDWRKLYPEGSYQKLRLPVTVFERKTFRLTQQKWQQQPKPKQEQDAKQESKQKQTQESKQKLTQEHTQEPRKPELLHPLLGRNASTLDEHRYTTQFSGDEFFLADHIVVGQKTLPGVAYVEMARAAGEMAGVGRVQRVKQIVWTRPLTIEVEPRDVMISLSRNGEMVRYEVWTEGSNGRRIVHGQGKLGYAEPTETPAPAAVIDLHSIQNSCHIITDSKQIYQELQQIGLAYGPSFQPIREFCCNVQEALSSLILPEVCNKDASEFVLHPTLLDGALQTVMGLVGKNADGGVYMPFSLGEVVIVKAPGSRCYAYVTQTEGGQGVMKYRILLTDESGQVLVEMNDFSVRAVEQKKHSAEDPLKNWLAKLEAGELDIHDVKVLMEGL
ncbi:type I polyketide synthase [Brevibacillus dissolubilis]|uniref:type I polyketide synthase n=1 Tax=Brevibacillus dissolubilis TaxID=1844116 RepID=UPI00111725E6|nr:beta-ketoacyl synthase N-terminal-like domain-containing protein [Brevibacillus dissolubilis]